jgi:hypothetical protein
MSASRNFLGDKLMMITRLKTLFAPALLVAGLAACGGGGGISSPSDALHEAASTSCAKIFSCQDSFPGTDADFETAFGANEAECVDNFEADADPSAADYEASVDAGRIVFNGDDAETCLAAFDDVTCEQLWGGTGPDQPDECETAFDGQVADGDACTIDEDCAESTSSCIDDVCGPG